jgi:hypothetical protein
MNPLRPLRPLLGILIAVFAVAGCRRPVPNAEDYAVVTCDNRSTENLVVYMVTDGGQRYRTGDAPALHFVKFTLGESRIREMGLVQFVAQRTTGDVVGFSDRVRLEVGDSVGFIVSR